MDSRVEVIVLQVWSLSRCLIPASLAFLSLRSLKGRGRDAGGGVGGGWRQQKALEEFLECPAYWLTQQSKCEPSALALVGVSWLSPGALWVSPSSCSEA